MTWHRLAPLDQITDGRISGFTVAEHVVALVRRGTELAAWQDECPHRGARFSECGLIDEDRLVCGWHYWAFDLADGRQTHLRDVVLRRYPVRLTDDGWVELEVA